MNYPEHERRWTELMEQSLQGDSYAYHDLLGQLTVAMRNIARRRVRLTGIDPEDVVQDVLLALHLKRSTWVRGTPVAPWVVAIARNKIVDALRRSSQHASIPLENVMESLSNEDHSTESQAIDIERVLGKLSARQQQVVRAVSLEGHSSQEAATQLQMTEGAVRVTLHRSLKSLAALFRAAPHVSGK